MPKSFLNMAQKNTCTFAVQVFDFVAESRLKRVMGHASRGKSGFQLLLCGALPGKVQFLDLVDYRCSAFDLHRYDDCLLVIGKLDEVILLFQFRAVHQF